VTSALKGYKKLLLDLGKKRIRKTNRFVKRSSQEERREADIFREKVDLIACWVSIQLE